MQISDYINKITRKIDWAFINESLIRFVPNVRIEVDTWLNYQKLVYKLIDEIRSSLGEYGYNIQLFTAAIFHNIKSVLILDSKDQITNESITRLLLWDEDIKTRESICYIIKHQSNVPNILDKSNYLEQIVNVTKNSVSWPDLLMFRECITKVYNITEDNKALKKIIGSIYVSDIITKQEVFDNDKAINVYLLIGLPGSGKSTFINNNLTGATVISRDIIRYELGMCGENEKIIGTKDEENNVTKIFNEKLINAAQLGNDIVLDNMNNKISYRNSYHHLLKDYNVVWHYIYIQPTTLLKNIERRADSIQGDQFYPMILRFEWPEFGEYNTFKIIQN